MTRENIKTIAIIVLAFVAIIFASLYHSKKKDLNVSNHNIEVLTDTITTYKMRNGELMEAKKSLILDLNELQKYTSIKESEVKEIQKKLDNKVAYIAKLESGISIDDVQVRVDSVIIKDTSLYQCHFSDITKYYAISGFTEVNTIADTSRAVINEISIPTNLTVGLTKEDWTIFVKSDNPYMNITNINGAKLDKRDYQKRPRFVISFGVNGGAQYDVIRRQFGVGVNVGIHVGYVLFAM